MEPHPRNKYRRPLPFSLPDRSWPDRQLHHPPVWCSSDLRDGNQALATPMDRGRKLQLFEMLVAIGFKEIEVAFPAASQTDFDFVRQLIEEDLIPEDVTIQVLTQARPELVARTFESLRGAPRAILHFYTATAPVFREVVFQRDRAGMVQLTVDAARLIRSLAKSQPATAWTFEYSPETFSATELDYAKEICDAVTEVWRPTPARKAILNLPATVEVSTPNAYADRIEWMHRNLERRDSVVLSVHPHNDRGTAVAAAELAVLAGAERVEGCLFGNGERTGNVDLVTLALNLYSQGVHPGLDLSQIDEIRRVAEACTGLPVHQRHPYAGDLVYTAFSGSHQDAIKKGFAARGPGDPWEVPYLPIDPADVGRSYAAVIRINSQSGKGGVAYVLESEYGFALPRPWQVELAGAVQATTDRAGAELAGETIHALFQRLFVDVEAPFRYLRHVVRPVAAGNRVSLEVEEAGSTRQVTGEGADVAAAVLSAVQWRGRIAEQHGHAIAGGGALRHIAYVAVQSSVGETRAVGIGPDPATATIKAVLAAVNRGSLVTAESAA